MLHLRLHISCLIAFLVFSNAAAQELPTLGKASEITVTKLPDGISCYLVKNPATTGFADFALVQKGVADKYSARVALSSLIHFGTTRPYQFLSDKGISYRRNGYVSYPSGATRYDFRGVPVYDRNVADSTLLILFDIISRSRMEQAIIVSGDIKPAEMLDRMKMLSLMVPALEPVKDEQYRWRPEESVKVRETWNVSPDVLTVKLSFRSPRTPRERMNTPQPLVAAMFAGELECILENRMRIAFRSKGIPLASMRSRYRDSASGDGDESHTFYISTSASKAHEAVSLIGSVLADIDRNGVSAAELDDARKRVVADVSGGVAAGALGNPSNVDRCVASYLYGANLESRSKLVEFFNTRRLPEEKERELFNNFASSLIDPEKNLSLNFDLPAGSTLTRGELLSEFAARWDEKPAADSLSTHSAFFADTLSLSRPIGKTSLARESKEPVSGGKMWTFGNGIKVVFRKTEGRGDFNYALMLRGGYDGVPDLKPGEGGFVGDMLALSSVAAMKGSDFHNMLRANGIKIKTTVSLSDLRIYGSAPESKLPLLLRALLSIANTRGTADAEFPYYKECERLRGQMRIFSNERVNAVVDSLMYPSFHYADRRNMESLGEDLPKRANEYFCKQFAKVNDGIFVITGNLNEDALKKTLSRHLGDFCTSKQRAVRPHLSYPAANGWSTYTIPAAESRIGLGEQCINIGLSAMMPFSTDNYMAFLLARVAIEKRLSRSLADAGVYAETSEKVELFPTERFTVFINCKQCRADGLPYGVQPKDALEALDYIRDAITQLTSDPLGQEELKACKAALASIMDTRYSDSANLIDAVMTRYSEGKDLVSGYKKSIEAITVESVSRILEALEKGCRVEYLII